MDTNVLYAGRLTPCRTRITYPALMGGLGVPENTVTLCSRCHDFYDNGAGGGSLKSKIADHLRGKYPDWGEKRLVYRKYDLPNM